jgi:hypothetical protein
MDLTYSNSNSSSELPLNSKTTIYSLNCCRGGRGGGRAASKAAQAKIASNVAELSNLNKKKRRPSTPAKPDESRYRYPTVHTYIIHDVSCRGPQVGVWLTHLKV